jgi:hypothetical protein
VRTELLSSTTSAWAAKCAPLVGFCLLLAVYHLVFSQFFPNRNGTVGHDYSLGIPHLLAGYYWFQANGIWEVPWFTPAFCGGQPFFADPQSGYYSVGQLLTLVVDPLTGAYLTMLLFATLGYWGFYVLLRRGFAVSRPPAVLAAAIFMFNGFFAHRMVVGHFGYHGIMLVPWFACFLILPGRVKSNPWLRNGAAGWAAGIVGAYWVQSGLGTLIVPAMLTVVVIILLREIWREPLQIGQLVYRSFVGGLTMIAISAAKVAAGLSFLSNYPRTDYLLPGYESVTASVEIAFLSLFVSPADIAQRSDALLQNVQWGIGRHELEYGVTVVPMLIIAMGAAVGIWRVITGRTGLVQGRAQIGAWALVVLILVAPIVLNTYTVEWNAVLKQTPLLKSASTFVRWYWIFIPFFALVSALVLERTFGAFRTSATIVAVALIVSLNLMQDRRVYALEPYDPGPAVHAYHRLRGGMAVPQIRAIGVYRDGRGSIVLPVHRNDALSQGYSPLYCYNPVFGYRLESFPFKDLHPGPVREVRDDHFNIKNPACYVYPKENECSPGDHFRETQREEMEKFVSYRPFAFNISTAQKAANALTVFGLVASVILVLAAGAFGLVNLISRARHSPTGTGPN